MPFKYLAQVFTFALVAGSCTPTTAPPSPTATSVSQTPTSTSRPDVAIGVEIFASNGPWFTVPDGLLDTPVGLVVRFAADPTPAAPVARLSPNGREAAFVRTTGLNAFTASLPLQGVAPGAYRVEILEHLATSDVVVATQEILVSAPEYIVWTLDFEGDASGDPALANTAEIADRFGIPMTIMWNPRVWTTTQVSQARADAMLAWTKARVARDDELSLHLHMWTDFVRAAGLVARTAPSWSGRGDGYDVPMTAYPETDQRTLLDYALRLMAEHGLARPTTFRAGGQFANDGTLRSLAGLGFVADASAVPAGAFGRLPYPWTLAPDAQPYRPSAGDANKAGDLSLLEAPTIGGNTYGYDAQTIEPIVRADLSYLAPAGEIAMTRRAITIVSHPGTIDATERAAIAALFDAFSPLRYDRHVGPVRFVTLAQLAQAWR